MDRRQRKTRAAIFTAFRSLLSRKRYEQITVQDILDEADVGRSTFYAHFETKDMLLEAMCNEIFDHIFEGSLCDYREHGDNLESKLSHILWHLYQQQADILAVLSGESSALFLSYFRQRLDAFFSLYLEDFSLDVPRDYLLHHLVGSFTETVRWSLKNGMKTSPEETARYFLQVMGK